VATIGRQQHVVNLIYMHELEKHADTEKQVEWRGMSVMK